MVFVRADATGAEDGSSWDDAFTSVQDAVTAAQVNLPGGSLKEIWIAEGTYRAGARIRVVADTVRVAVARAVVAGADVGVVAHTVHVRVWTAARVRAQVHH